MTGAPQRLKEERERLGLSQRDFAARAGVSKNTQLAYEAGNTDMTVAFVAGLEKFGVDPLYVMSGIPATDSPRLVMSPQSATTDDALDLVEVGEIDLAYGLGGTFSDMPIEAEIVRFDRAWLASITRTPPALLTFARGRGDSMQPTLQDGDIVLIDRSVRTVREQDAIWALTIGDIAMIKRVRISGERVSILSDNDRVPPDDVHHEEINVVGRVIFIGRKI